MSVSPHSGHREPGPTCRCDAQGLGARPGPQEGCSPVTDRWHRFTQFCVKAVGLGLEMCVLRQVPPPFCSSRLDVAWKPELVFKAVLFSLTTKHSLFAAGYWENM